MTDEVAKKTELTLKEEQFCQLYATEKEFFGNGVQSYVEAYNPDKSKPNWYNVACVYASELLSKPKVFNRINELLVESGFNDVAVDKQLAFTINQHADLRTKVAAIREYNKLKQRIIDRQDITSGGKPLPILGALNVSVDHGNQKDIPVEEAHPSDTRGNISQQDHIDTPIIDKLSAE